MEKKYFLLGSSDTSIMVKIMRVLFGLACLAIAVFWLIYNINSIKSDRMLWITIVFLSGFGFYQIWAGFGKATRFIEVGDLSITLKKNAILPAAVMNAQDIGSIRLYPLNFIFLLKSGKKILLRLGTTYNEINADIKDAVISFADANDIPFDIVQESI
jgi:hypothetical protein